MKDRGGGNGARPARPAARSAAQDRTNDLFDRVAKAVKIEDYAKQHVAKLHLVAGTNTYRAPCPLCDASPNSGSVFKVDADRQDWYCFACEKHGDVTDLHAALTNLTIGEAARELAGAAPMTPAKAKPAPQFPLSDDKDARIMRMAAEMWHEATPVVAGLALDYLIGRRIDAAIAAEALARTAAVALHGLRYHPAAPHSWSAAAKVWVRAPAIIARPVTPGGWTGGVHVTYLDPAGGKTRLDPAKRMWGRQRQVTQVSSRRGGAWLTDPDGPGHLVIGEGIESALSLATWLKARDNADLRIAAALTLNSLQGGVEKDKDGCIDMWAARGDQASPPFLWPPCNTGGAGVYVAIDRDMSPQKFKARTGRGRVTVVILDAEARAKLCAVLACRAWRAAGWAFAKPMWPRPNGDWNDHLNSRTAD